MRWTAIPLSLIVFGLLYLFFGRDAAIEHPDPTGDVEANTLEPQVPADLIEQAGPESQAETDNSDPTETGAALSVESVWECLGETDPETVPLIAADADRLEPYMTNHASMSNYRSIDRESLKQLAEQGDSAAMVVLATAYSLAAFGLDNSEPTEYLAGQRSFIITEQAFPEESGVTKMALELARYWFYEAAVHGRYAALAQVGLLDARAGKTAVDLGWIDQQAYDELPADELRNWSPYIVYQELAHTMMADAWTGPNAELAEIDGFFLRDTQSDVVDGLLNEFVSDIQSRGLLIQTVDSWQGPSLAEILSDVCPDVIAAPAR